MPANALATRPARLPAPPASARLLTAALALSICGSACSRSPSPQTQPPAPSQASPVAPAPPDDAAAPTTQAPPQDQAEAPPAADAPVAGDAPASEDAAPAPAPPPRAAAADASLPKDSLLRAQVLLERAFFSPGEIDGEEGSNQARALTAYQKAHDLDPSGKLDEATWRALDADAAPILIDYAITEADTAGPFRETPKDNMAKAELDALPYASIEEALGERFHASPDLLRKLNPQADFTRAGTVIAVPNVAAAAQLPSPERVVVRKALSALQLVDAEGKVYAQYPVTTGSAQFPLPIGTWKINGVGRDPVWHFDPKLIAGTKKTDRKAVIPAGPNNPVGTTWIDLSKEHYGIHGTAEPSRIGKTESNGCIRMTNWSVEAVSRVVKPGMQALLEP